MPILFLLYYSIIKTDRYGLFFKTDISTQR